MRQAKKLKRLKSILVSKTYYIFLYLRLLTYLLTYLLVMTANAVDLLSKPREKRKNANFFVDAMGAHATPWDAEVLGLFFCKLAPAQSFFFCKKK